MTMLSLLHDACGSRTEDLTLYWTGTCTLEDCEPLRPPAAVVQHYRRILITLLSCAPRVDEPSGCDAAQGSGSTDRMVRPWDQRISLIVTTCDTRRLAVYAST